jgi:Uncharacterized conserved protein
MLYVVLGIIMVFWAWMQAAMGKLQKYKRDARAQWVRVDALLQTRSQYVLDLLEQASEQGLDADELMAEIYDLGGGYCKSEDREAISACAEKAAPLIDRFLALAHEFTPLKEDKEFKELEEGLAELEEEMEAQCKNYNQFIDLYNKHREKPALRPQMMILGAIPLRGIHIVLKNLADFRTV